MSSAPKIVASGNSCRRRTLGAQEIFSAMMQGLLALRDRRSFRNDKPTRRSPSWWQACQEKTLDLISNWGRIVAISDTVSSQIYVISASRKFWQK
jgi:hypothetical protein